MTNDEIKKIVLSLADKKDKNKWADLVNDVGIIYDIELQLEDILGNLDYILSNPVDKEIFRKHMDEPHSLNRQLFLITVIKKLKK
uniref:Uncharacterized protein n=1 Tax=viral metagenome TaxID=1070528 RepID=A0A6C0D221_9ZZZZ